MGMIFSTYILLLQLGHGDEAVETKQRRFEWSPDWYPLQLGHGDEAVETWEAANSSSCAIVLQLGHGDEAVETPKGGRTSESRKGFNWATAMKPWRHEQARPTTFAVANASIGPRR